MTVSAVVSPLTAEAFVIASEPPPGLGAACRTSPRGGAKDRPDPAYLYSMRRSRPPARRHANIWRYALLFQVMSVSASASTVRRAEDNHTR